MRTLFRNDRSTAFTLVEILIAIVFVSIGFFGYVALHSRLLHSGVRLEEREVIRSGTDFMESVEATRAQLGYEESIDGTTFQTDLRVPKLVTYSTSTKNRNLSWLENYPEPFRRGVHESIPMTLKMYREPFRLQWNQR